jgi:V/A-type H+-transporting ATPase subunit D
MQLLRLRRRIALARRGHKLLKDKLDGLVQRFNEVKNSYLSLHDTLEPKLSGIFLKSLMAYALSPEQALDMPKAKVSVETSIKNIMGVKIPSYRIKVEGEPVYNQLLSTVELSEAVGGFSAVLPELVKLAAASRALRLLASQIIETRRRVNALEYVLIPELERNASFIRMKLSEQERSTRVVLLKLGGK